MTPSAFTATRLPRWAHAAAAALAIAALAACSPKSDAPVASAPVAASAPATAASSAPAKAFVEGPPGPFTIEGVYPNAPKGVVVRVLKFDERGAELPEPLATAVVKDGRYRIEGQIDEYQPVRLEFGGNQNFYTDFFLEPGHYTVEAPRIAAWVSGGVVNDIITRQRKDPKEQEIHQRTRRFEGRATLSKAEQTEYEALYAQGRALSQKAITELLADDTVPLRAKLRALQFNPDPAAVSPDARLKWADRFERELGTHPVIDRQRQAAQAMTARMEAQQKVAVGGPFVDITVQDAQGKSHKLSDVVKANKLVLLDFWASWCAPCRAEFPNLRQAYTDYHAKGFEIFSVSTDEDQAAWDKASAEEKMPWLNYADLRGAKAEAPNAYGVEGLPSNYLIAQDGRIVAAQVRGEALSKVLAEHLGAAKRAAAAKP